jgi:hypothetical protein
MFSKRLSHMNSVYTLNYMSPRPSNMINAS